MELYQLEQFLKVSECSNLSRAAELLFITQPALSRSMKKLEEELEVELFEHGKNKIELTPAGLYTAKKARVLLDNASAMKEDVKKYYESLHTISLGFCSPFIQSDALMTNLARKFSGQKITTEVRNEDFLLKGIKEGKYEIIVFSRNIEDEDLYCFPFLTERLFAMINKEDALARKASLFLEDLKGRSLMLLPQDGYWNDILSSFFKGQHLLRQKDIKDYNEIIASSSIISFITSTVLNHLKLPEGRLAVPLEDESCSIEYCYVCSRKNKEKYIGCFENKDLISNI